ncbi:hypothetical protein EDF51_106179 [Curtobacterium sp. PhB25]|uniref:DUF6941 family protein n=1 Tax=Curtobacterium sp. PhB25 TaxID=2485205 RepID=UPI001064EE77|nr:hypothetical protein [Curtobacterium sp. PhB25]TDW69195.1 hypothetical protein EDF51_106179 [Curtobacterium sp. PhB25]
MAELDYAFLADYAQVEGGKLSALGASYTHASVPSATSMWMTSIAGRVKTSVDADPVELEIQITAPEGAFEISQNATLEVGPGARPYADGRVGLLFASTVALPVFGAGLYEVTLKLDGEFVRRLAFDMSVES